YKSWMYNETKEDLPYPNVSNTHYGSHGDAAGLLIVYQDYFIQFMEFIYAKKNQPGFTNFELNFYSALKNTET
ncbi:hypothetical protein L208DRAFT_1210821, partial [Tricholoma matsutake]